jgi:histidyl-tRNA synthetase
MAAVAPVKKVPVGEHTEFGEVVSKNASGRPDYTVNDPLSTPQGFIDYDARTMTVTTQWKRLLAETYAQYGFTEIDPPPVEYSANLQLTGGLDKQIFGVSRMQDGSLTKLGLPFDRTVPMAIFIAKNATRMTFPYSRYDIGWSWRGEHAAPGRYRAFIQADVDTVAPTLSPLADANCIVTLIKGLQRLGVPSCNVLLNHVGVAYSFLSEEGIAPDHFKDALRVIDKLKPDNEGEVVKELAATLPNFSEEKAKALLQKMSYRGSLSGFAFQGKPTEEGVVGLAHLRKIEELALLMGIQPGVLQFAPGLARGLNYYTGVIFETFMPGREKYGSIASGGRYDNLVGEFNSRVKLQGVGGSIGMTRLYDVMKLQGLVDLSKQTSAQVYVGYRTEAEQATALRIATALRELGINTEINATIPKVKKQLQHADDKGIPYTILAMNSDEIVVKETRLKKTSEAQTNQHIFTTIDDAVRFVQGLIRSQKVEEAPTERKVG